MKAKKKTVIAFERKATDGIYTDLAKNVFPDANVITISNFRGIGDIWTGDYIYDGKNEAISVEFLQYKEDIIQRCRFLRSIDSNLAFSLALRFWNAMMRLFDSKDISAVFQPMIDEYTLDIMERVASLHKVPVVSFVGHFFGNYFRVTSRGELNNLRESIEEKEINAVYSKVLEPVFKPSFERMKEKSQFQILIIYFRRKLIEDVYYPLMKIIEHDPLNYHYNTCVLKGSGFNYVSSGRYKKFSSLEEIRKLKRETMVYLPLHMIPEATTDYWCDDWRMTRYEEGILSLLDRSDPRINFIVKEHPSMDGWRNPSFYSELSGCENVYLMKPHENSNQILDLVDNVAVHTGSVGVEALMRGKRVFCLTQNYYSDLHPAAIHVSALTLDQLIDPVPKYDSYIFIEDLLKGLYPGVWVPNKKCRESSFEALVAASKLYLNNFDK